MTERISVSFVTLITLMAVILGSHSTVAAFAVPKRISNSLLADRCIHFEGGNKSPKSLNIECASINFVRSDKKAFKKSFSLSSSKADTVEDGGSDDHSISRGRLLLVFVAILYGSLNVLLRFVYDVPEVPPTAAALSATRGWLAFLCFLPPLILNRQKLQQEFRETTQYHTKISNRLLLFQSGLELAVWGFLAQGLLNVGLLSTGSARASFLTQTSVLFTPLLSTVIGKQSVSKNVWAACVVALVGLVVLTLGAGGGGAAAGAFAISLSRGDIFVLGGALSWSMYLFRISSLGPKHPDLLLQGVKTGLMAVFYSVWWMASSVMSFPGANLFAKLPSWMGAGWVVWAALFLSAIGPGTIADVLQQKAQKSVAPSEANILLSAEPVFATLFAVTLLGERSSLLELAGGFLIGAAAVVASA